MRMICHFSRHLDRYEIEKKLTLRGYKIQKNPRRGDTNSFGSTANHFAFEIYASKVEFETTMRNMGFELIKDPCQGASGGASFFCEPLPNTKNFFTLLFWSDRHLKRP